MITDRKIVIERLCALATNVGADVFNHVLAHDCFCDEDENFCFDEKVIEFIEDSVYKAIETKKVLDKINK